MSNLTMHELRGLLAVASDSLDGIEDLRIATENRLRQLTRNEPDSDGEIRGYGLPPEHPQVASAQSVLDGLLRMEHEATLNLQRLVRMHPVYPLIKREKGLGEKQCARLLAAIGDPYWNDLHDRPRTVSELWSYSGYGVESGVARRRTKGVQSNWSDTAKSRAFLVATSIVKTKGRYRELYDALRAKYADSVHPKDCVRCGPSGKPALAGTPLSPGHQHARALRGVAKEVLKDMWIEARNSRESGMVSE